MGRWLGLFSRLRIVFCTPVLLNRGAQYTRFAAMLSSTPRSNVLRWVNRVSFSRKAPFRISRFRHRARSNSGTYTHSCGQSGPYPHKDAAQWGVGRWLESMPMRLHRRRQKGFEIGHASKGFPNMEPIDPTFDVRRSQVISGLSTFALLKC